MRGRRLPGIAVLSPALLLLAGCDDPTVLRPAPELDRAMILTMVFDPDSAAQALFIEAVDVDGRFEGWIHAEIFDAHGMRVAAQTRDSTTQIPDDLDRADALLPCAQRYGLLGSANPATCIRFELRPEYGAGYRVRVAAQDRPPAVAETRVPGDFEIVDVDASGAPPGTAGLYLRWTPSEGAYRYIVAIRSENVACYNVRGCLDGWYTDTGATELRTTVPASELEAGSGPWHVDVYALDRALFEYLTTGSGGDMFAVPPVENVEGGYGVVGSWLRRSRRIGF